MISQWEHAPRQCVAASTFERYSFSLLMAILQAATRPIPHPQQNDDPSDATMCHMDAPPGESYQVHLQRESVQQDHSHRI